MSFVVRIDSEYSDLIEELAKKPFATMAEALVFCSLVGKQFDRREELEGIRPNPIEAVTFERADLDSYIYMIAVSDVGNIEILSDEKVDQAVTCFEEYAKGGLTLLTERKADEREPLIDVILNLMMEVANAELQKEKKSKAPDITIRRPRRNALNNKLSP